MFLDSRVCRHCSVFSGAKADNGLRYHMPPNPANAARPANAPYPDSSDSSHCFNLILGLIIYVMIKFLRFGANSLLNRRPLRFLLFANLWVATTNYFAWKYHINDLFVALSTSLLMIYLLFRYKAVLLPNLQNEAGRQ
jgi:hypothetical protein